MWQVRAQLNKPNKENPGGELEWSGVLVDTQEEAEAWWKTRTGFDGKGTVHTMYDPAGEVVRVKFG
jgi:hypothetical protein